MNDEFIFVAAAFVGGWLLFAGPVYQAMFELRMQERIRDGIASVVGKAPLQRRVSGWWWLLPPVAFARQRRLSRKFQKWLFAALSPHEVQQWLRVTEKATGWWLVAAGAFLIAFNETGQLLELLEAPSWLAVPVAVVSISLALTFTVSRLQTAKRIEKKKQD